MQIHVPAMLRKNHLVVRLVAMLLATSCLMALLTQIAMARTTYVIKDGEQTLVHTTYETVPADVLDEAGLALGADDIYTTQTADGVTEITVQRSQLITIDNCGEVLQVSTYGESVESLLGSVGLPPVGDDYKVSQPMDAPTYDGMQITITHMVERRQTYTEDIPYEVTYCYDPGMPEGQEKVIVEGAVGQKLITADVTYVNTVEQNRTVLEETVAQEPVDRIVSVGTATETVNPNAPAIGDGVIITAEGEMLTYSKTGQFKTTAYNHTDAGCDMITATGTTVRLGTVAVDPTVVPYGTRMFIVANDGSYVYGLATAEDCGGGVKGNHIDLYYPTKDECWEYGVRSATVYFLD